MDQTRGHRDWAIPRSRDRWQQCRTRTCEKFQDIADKRWSKKNAQATAAVEQHQKEKRKPQYSQGVKRERMYSVLKRQVRANADTSSSHISARQLGRVRAAAMAAVNQVMNQVPVAQQQAQAPQPRPARAKVVAVRNVPQRQQYPARAQQAARRIQAVFRGRKGRHDAFLTRLGIDV